MTPGPGGPAIRRRNASRRPSIQRGLDDFADDDLDTGIEAAVRFALSPLFQPTGTSDRPGQQITLAAAPCRAAAPAATRRRLGHEHPGGSSVGAAGETVRHH
ncbi:hypothetical protein ACFWPH_20965 [Nocardia sp. NPDC058499]|uniref:hypothetical protein n=1 Tax=Nocardia sp. NPDC058499 TaxID=3346530 RepID=UPI00365188EE